MLIFQGTKLYCLYQFIICTKIIIIHFECFSPVKLKKKFPIHIKSLENGENDDDDDESEEDELYNEAFKGVMRQVIRVVISNVTKAPDDILLEEAANLLWNITSDIYEVNVAIVNLRIRMNYSGNIIISITYHKYHTIRVEIV